MRTELSYSQFISALAAPDDDFDLLPCRPVASLIRLSVFSARLSDIILCNVMKRHAMFQSYDMGISCDVLYCHAMLRKFLHDFVS